MRWQTVRGCTDQERALVRRAPQPRAKPELIRLLLRVRFTSEKIMRITILGRNKLFFMDYYSRMPWERILDDGIFPSLSSKLKTNAYYLTVGILSFIVNRQTCIFI